MTGSWNPASRLTAKTLYAVHDILPFLQGRINTLGLILGHGIFANSEIGHFTPLGKTPLLRAQFEFEFADGRREVLGADQTWKVAAGPILKDSHFLGGATTPGLSFLGTEMVSTIPSGNPPCLRKVRPRAWPRISSRRSGWFDA